MPATKKNRKTGRLQSERERKTGKERVTEERRKRKKKRKGKRKRKRTCACERVAAKETARPRKRQRERARASERANNTTEERESNREAGGGERDTWRPVSSHWNHLKKLNATVANQGFTTALNKRSFHRLEEPIPTATPLVIAILTMRKQTATPEII